MSQNKAIDLEKLKTPFPEDEIEWRIGQAGKKGNGTVWAMCLAYVQARAIMERLDSVCGPENWKVTYRFEGQTGVIAMLSIKINGEWITKEDGAEQTDIEAFKGGISSALKRAGSAWGIGRYLYDLDSGFAKIVDDKKGAKWGQFTDKQTKERFDFYWLPPPLPAWALPEGATVQRQSIHAQQPGPQDGVAVTPKAVVTKPDPAHTFNILPTCDCGSALVFSEKKLVWYCKDFKNTNHQHIRAISQEIYSNACLDLNSQSVTEDLPF